ncbi:MAG: hypothetical protein LQ351_007366 [Letrouitia transgressa]|nr:MAG: hypothetical protein LQ351_007366 [Letrouitia transgressa]
MGQASSQIGSVSPPGKRQSMETSSRSHRSRERQRKEQNGRTSKLADYDAVEEDSASALTSLWTGPHRTPSIDNDYAASLQLHNESSPIQPSSQPTWNDFRSSASNLSSQNKRKDKAIAKRHRRALEKSSDQGNAKAGSKYHSPKIPYGKSRLKTYQKHEAYQSQAPTSTLSLDDIDENDEDVAQLYREYESLEPLRLSLKPQRDTLEPELSSDFTDAAIQESQKFLDPSPSSHPLSPPYTSPEAYNQAKAKRKRQSRGVSTDNGTDQESLNGTGQHTPDVDFDAFDALLMNHGMDLANPFDDGSDNNLRTDAPGPYPNERLSEISGLSSRSPPASSQDKFAEQSLGKLQHVLSSHKTSKRRRTDAQNPVNGTVLAYNSLDPENEGQQNDVAQEEQDFRQNSSPEVADAQLENQGQVTPDPPELGRRHQRVPSPLPNRSARRGNKTQRGGHRGKDYNPPLAEIAKKGGMFLPQEINKLDSFCGWFCEENNINQQQFNDMIHSSLRGNAEITNFYNEIYALIPYRTRQSIFRFCRRHFHNFAARGVWTESDDERLRDAVAQRGRSWKAVGEIIERFPEDCRDRYRNYLVNLETRNKDQWSTVEIQRLVKAIDECILLMTEERRIAREERHFGRELPASESESDEEIEQMKFINWQIVSDKMGGTRSRLQCSHKWNGLKNEERAKHLRQVRRARKAQKLGRKATKKKQWRLRRATRKLNNMKIGDMMDFVQVLSKCGAASEAEIPWRALGSQEFRSKWSTIDLKAAFKIFKEQVAGSANMPYQEVLNRVYINLMEQDTNDLETRWDPKVHGDIRKETQTKSQQMKEKADKNSTKKGKAEIKEQIRRTAMSKKQEGVSKVKSSLFVNPSDEEEDEEEGQDERTPSQESTQAICHPEGQDNKSNNPRSNSCSGAEDNERSSEFDSLFDDNGDQDSDRDSLFHDNGNRDSERDSLFDDDGDQNWSHDTNVSPTDEGTEEQRKLTETLNLEDATYSVTQSHVSETTSDSSDEGYAANGGLDGELVDQLRSLRNAK